MKYIKMVVYTLELSLSGASSCPEVFRHPSRTPSCWIVHSQHLWCTLLPPWSGDTSKSVLPLAQLTATPSHCSWLTNSPSACGSANIPSFASLAVATLQAGRTLAVLSLWIPRFSSASGDLMLVWVWVADVFVICFSKISQGTALVEHWSAHESDWQIDAVLESGTEQWSWSIGSLQPCSLLL